MVNVKEILNTREILLFILQNYGIKSQLNVAIEEMSELTKELCKYNRDKADINHICEEIADAKIMLDQLTLAFDEGLINRIYNEKLNRQLGRIKNGEK